MRTLWNGGTQCPQSDKERDGSLDIGSGGLPDIEKGGSPDIETGGLSDIVRGGFLDIVRGGSGRENSTTSIPYPL